MEKIELTDSQREQIQTLAPRLTQAQLADYLGFSERTLRNIFDRDEFDGSHWEIDLPATSWEDAEQRLSAIVNDGISNRLTMARLEESSPVEDMSVYPPGYC